jgi:formylglycine-generating enzyme required for sulfatase activity
MHSLHHRNAGFFSPSRILLVTLALMVVISTASCAQSDPKTPPACTKAGRTWTSPVDGMTLVCVPAGAFSMGSEDGDDDEKPLHEVTLDAFWIDSSEVTNAMFAAFVEATGYQTEAEIAGLGNTWTGDKWAQVEGTDWQHPQGPDSSIIDLANHPVVQVSWNDAKAYCEWTERRLPTEAEWEKAARGTDNRTYPWGNEQPDGSRLNFADINLDVDWADRNADDGYLFTAPVGSYADGASPYGALDMAGNVLEWATDWYGEKYYQDSPGQNPQGPASGESRMLRGGSWYAFDYLLRAAYRGNANPSYTDDGIGFRCARSG